MQTPAPPSKPRPPYLLGLLCLIPLVGALVGLALLLYGIIRYKDKWLIAIGAFGMVWTTLIYSFLFTVVFNSPIARNGFAEIAQKDLNSLIPSIEYYKTKNGHYPDTLRQVLTVDMMAPVNDPLQLSFRRATESYFNYNRVGDKYYLFSSGKDGIPYTRDDLYPQIDSAEGSRIGLIRPPKQPH